MTLKPQSPTRPTRATNNEPEKRAFTDMDLVTVLHGFGKVLPTDKHLVDNVEFRGGIAKSVPFSLAKHWAAGTRPDGRKSEGRVIVQILPNDADEDDMMIASGVSPDDMGLLLKRFKHLTAKNIIDEIGIDNARALAEQIQSEKNWF